MVKLNSYDIDPFKSFQSKIKHHEYMRDWILGLKTICWHKICFTSKFFFLTTPKNTFMKSSLTLAHSQFTMNFVLLKIVSVKSAFYQFSFNCFINGKRFASLDKRAFKNWCFFLFYVVLTSTWLCGNFNLIL